MFANRFVSLLTLFSPNARSPLSFKFNDWRDAKEKEEKFLILFPAKLSVVRVLLKLEPTVKLYNLFSYKFNVTRDGRVLVAKFVKRLSDKSRLVSFWRLFPVKFWILFDAASSDSKWGKLTSLISWTRFASKFNLLSWLNWVKLLKLDMLLLSILITSMFLLILLFAMLLMLLKLRFNDKRFGSVFPSNYKNPLLTKLRNAKLDKFCPLNLESLL